ncbi:hypothetical protein GCM10007160_18350 [Litchfieldella qijiaojingensis]|uniref:Uncharacterized protein n=1 Tax=Litchfieldella qijiaojingensis TaxID=980347 RepID=A0ABQ2YSI3_9GAMM|nr:hypothetical protein [Halomonas qijiaojingensis]GGX91190.1 hypothetical protein GCM10007160_18350 [Halomonas qijiaojingensis]
MTPTTVRLATEADALSLAPRLRKADRKEIEAADRTPEEALLAGVRSPDPTYVAVDEEDVPHIIFGTAPSPDPILGFVWMMATPAIRLCWVRLLRETPQWIDRLSEDYSILANVVHADNSVHIRWLKWAGFIFLRKVQFNGESFYEFARVTNTGG